MFSVLNEILRLVCLNNLVINLVCRPTYVNLAHFVFVFSFRSCVCVSLVGVIFSRILTSYLLLCNICFIVSYSFLLFVSHIGNVDRRLTRYLIAASFDLVGGKSHWG